MQGESNVESKFSNDKWTFIFSLEQPNLVQIYHNSSEKNSQNLNSIAYERKIISYNIFFGWD